MDRVDLIVSSTTFWKIVAAIVVGCAIYDLILWSFETVAKSGPEVIRAWRRSLAAWVSGLRDSAEEKWRRWLGEKPPKPQYVPEPPERTPAAAWCFNEATRALHLAECRYAGSCTPWHWASSMEEARYFAREQGLKVGCSCRPVGDLSAVSG